MKNFLVAYFSPSGNTKRLASDLAKTINADLYEIKPEKEYTKEDLDWRNKNSRSSLEMSNKSSRPKLKDNNLDVSQYDVIYLGFPIWWYVAPTLINTFLESYDFQNKKIILFATSGGSSWGNTRKELLTSVSNNTTLIEGKVFHGSYTLNDLKDMIDNL